jgi:anaerobic selenocysteine-containing dehydrogenase
VAENIGPLHESEISPRRSSRRRRGRLRPRLHPRGAAPPKNLAPTGAPIRTPKAAASPACASTARAARFPDAFRLLEFYSSTLVDWGWPEYALPTYIRSHVHPANLAPGEVPLISTFRVPIQIHTRSANAKWLDEIAHTNPLWLHPRHAAEIGVETGDLVRVETHTGHFVVKAWVTEGIRPGVVACSHHMGRWKLPDQDGQRQMMATVDLDHQDARWSLRRLKGAAPYASPTPTRSASGGPTSACTRT